MKGMLPYNLIGSTVQASYYHRPDQRLRIAEDDVFYR